MKPANGSVKRWLDEAFLAETDDCLIIPFKRGNHGYVPVTVDGVKTLAHRYICQKMHGPSGGKHAAHRCGDKACANKRHLRWATRKENEADKLIHGRRHRGSDHPNAKLSVDDVNAIRAAVGNQSVIAAQYGIVQQTVSDIKCGRRWSWA